MRFVFILLSFIAKSISKFVSWRYRFTDELECKNRVCSFSFASRLNCHKLIPKLIELLTIQIAPCNWNKSSPSYLNLFWKDTVNGRISFLFSLIGLLSVTHSWKLSHRRMHPHPSLTLFTLEFTSVHSSDNGIQHHTTVLLVKFRFNFRVTPLPHFKLLLDAMTYLEVGLKES